MFQGLAAVMKSVPAVYPPSYARLDRPPTERLSAVTSSIDRQQLRRFWTSICYLFIAVITKLDLTTCRSTGPSMPDSNATFDIVGAIVRHKWRQIFLIRVTVNHVFAIRTVAELVGVGGSGDSPPHLKNYLVTNDGKWPLKYDKTHTKFYIF